MKIIITLMFFLMLIPAASALSLTDEISETTLIFHQCSEHIGTDEPLLISGQLTYVNGTELTIEYLDNVRIHIYLNGIKTYSSRCNGTGEFSIGLPHESNARFDPLPYHLRLGVNDIKLVFEGKEYRSVPISGKTKGLHPCESPTQTVYVYESVPYETDDIDIPPKLQWIAGVFKGLFLISAVLGIFSGGMFYCGGTYGKSASMKGVGLKGIFGTICVVFIISASITLLFTIYNKFQ